VAQQAEQRRPLVQEHPNVAFRLGLADGAFDGRQRGVELTVGGEGECAHQLDLDQPTPPLGPDCRLEQARQQGLRRVRLALGDPHPGQGHVLGLERKRLRPPGRWVVDTQARAGGPRRGSRHIAAGEMHAGGDGIDRGNRGREIHAPREQPRLGQHVQCRVGIATREGHARLDQVQDQSGAFGGAVAGQVDAAFEVCLGRRQVVALVVHRRQAGFRGAGDAVNAQRRREAAPQNVFEQVLGIAQPTLEHGYLAEQAFGADGKVGQPRIGRRTGRCGGCGERGDRLGRTGRIVAHDQRCAEDDRGDAVQPVIDRQQTHGGPRQLDRAGIVAVVRGEVGADGGRLADDGRRV
jgi:hypothetical protein